jgi:DNA recombination protein RmuC
MELLYAIIAVLALACVVFLVLWIRERGVSRTLGDELLTSNTTLQSLEASLSAQTDELTEERRAREQEQMARVKAETELSAERRMMAEKVRSQEEVERTMREQFKALAGDVLGEQSRRFKEENRESMDLILKPFKDNIVEFRTRVESIFTHQNEQSGVLKNELQRLMELNVQITTETTNLTNALRGNSKVQGDWGEVILETILDNSNLIRGVHYQTQLNVKDETGSNLRPDVVLYLPKNTQLVIGSTVSLTPEFWCFSCRTNPRSLMKTA